MKESRVAERREFETYNGSEEIRFVLHEKDRIEIADESGNWTITIQDDERGSVEISLHEGRAVFYT